MSKTEFAGEPADYGVTVADGWIKADYTEKFEDALFVTEETDSWGIAVGHICIYDEDDKFTVERNDRGEYTFKYLTTEEEAVSVVEGMMHG